MYCSQGRTDKNECLVPVRQVSGCNDDILDILVIPQISTHTQNTEENNEDNDHENKMQISDNNSISKAIMNANQEIKKEKKFLLALITNSPQVQTKY